MNVVLADGSLETVDSESDLWWGLRGAGHNFGIVTSVKSKVYDIKYKNWAIEIMLFSGNKIEEIYDAANECLLKNSQMENVISWSYWLNDPDSDPNNVSKVP